MSSCKIIRYRFSYWTKGYNKGKINVVLETETGKTMLVENLSPDHGDFLLNFLSTHGKLTCDPESNEGILHLSHSIEEFPPTA